MDVLDLPDARDVLVRLMESLVDPLPAILVAHVVDGTPKTQIARELGISRRTMVRYWQEIKIRAAEVIADGA